MDAVENFLHEYLVEKRTLLQVEKENFEAFSKRFYSMDALHVQRRLSKLTELSSEIETLVKISTSEQRGFAITKLTGRSSEVLFHYEIEAIDQQWRISTVGLVCELCLGAEDNCLVCNGKGWYPILDRRARAVSGLGKQPRPGGNSRNF